MDFVERNQRIDFARVGWARTREIQGFNDDQLKFLLRTFPNLNRLEVNLTNASMPALNQLIGSSIEILVARFDVSQPKKFALIGKMKKLKGLDLMNCRLVDEHLSCLAGLTNLQVLELGFNHISGSGLADLKNLARLRSLNLVRTQFGKDQLRHLSNFKGLQSLSLAQAEFDGRELRVIQDLPELAGLELAETRVNSSDLQFLSEMESLARVSFEGCKNIRSLQGVIPPNLNELNLVFTELENLDPLKNSTVRKLLIQSKREEVLELIEANENIQFVNELPIEEYRRLSE